MAHNNIVSSANDCPAKSKQKSMQFLQKLIMHIINCIIMHNYAENCILKISLKRKMQLTSNFQGLFLISVATN